jgi:hypothetical protein
MNPHSPLTDIVIVHIVNINETNPQTHPSTHRTTHPSTHSLNPSYAKRTPTHPLPWSKQADVVVNGKSIEQCQPFINITRHFQLISEMSANDLATLGHSKGFSPTLDNPKSAKYQSTYASTASGSGNGLSHNSVFAAASDNQIAVGPQNTLIGNAANHYRIWNL